MSEPWEQIDPTELYEGQRVRQGARAGRVLSWRWRPERLETVVDVAYDGGDRTQWVVRDGTTVTALPCGQCTSAMAECPIQP